MTGKVTQRVQYLTAKAMADLVANDGLSPEVQAQLHFYLSKLADEFNQHSLLGHPEVGDSAFKNYLSSQINQFLTTGQWPDNFKALPIPPGSPI